MRDSLPEVGRLLCASEFDKLSERTAGVERRVELRFLSHVPKGDKAALVILEDTNLLEALLELS